MTDKPKRALIKYFDRDLVEPWVLKVKAFINDIKHLSEN